MKYNSADYVFYTLLNYYEDDGKTAIRVADILNEIEIEPGAFKDIKKNQEIIIKHPVGFFRKGQNNDDYKIKEIRIKERGEITLTGSLGNGRGSIRIEIKPAKYKDSDSDNYAIESIKITIIDNVYGIYVLKSKEHFPFNVNKPYLIWYDAQALAAIRKNYKEKDDTDLLGKEEEDYLKLGFEPDDCTFIEEEVLKDDNIGHFLKDLLTTTPYSDLIKLFKSFNRETKYNKYLDEKVKLRERKLKEVRKP